MRWFALFMVSLGLPILFNLCLCLCWPHRGPRPGGLRIEGLVPGDYGTHSFRSGGATALMAAGYDIAYIKMMGRWSSSCFERYLRLDISAVQDMARAM